MITATDREAEPNFLLVDTRLLNETPKRSARGQLSSLTSLRFVAAAMVVLFHAQRFLPMDKHFQATIIGAPLYQGVSFFFILSGFILSYAYKELDDRKSILQFYGARISRIWPVFAATALLTFIIEPRSIIVRSAHERLAVFATQTFMVHSWFANKIYAAALNLPSWSVSAEFFFYLSFPFLIAGLRRTWLQKAILVILPLITIYWFCYSQPALFAQNHEVITHELTYTNPVGRIFEFYSGMLLFLLATKIDLRSFGPLKLTLLELGALFLCGIELTSHPIVSYLIAHQGQKALIDFFSLHANDMGFCLLILFIATEGGAVSKMLRLPVLVFLGEISYSVYLLHWPLLTWYVKYQNSLPSHSPALINLTYWCVLLSLSALSLLLLERPMRRKMKLGFDSLIDRLPGLA